jgi:hypothetical protein
MKKLLSLLLMGILSVGLVACSSTKSTEALKEEPKKVETVKELVAKFEEAKLSVVEPKDMTPDDFGMGPMVTKEAMIFKVDAEKDQNARVFKIDNQEDLNKLKAYYDDMAKESAMLYSHTYAKGKFLIQANGEIPQENFDKYTKVMDENIK